MKMTLSRRVTWMILPDDDGLLWCRLCDWLIFKSSCGLSYVIVIEYLYKANQSPLSFSRLLLQSPSPPQDKVVKKRGREKKDLTSLFSLEIHLMKIHTSAVRRVNRQKLCPKKSNSLLVMEANRSRYDLFHMLV